MVGLAEWTGDVVSARELRVAAGRPFVFRAICVSLVELMLRRFWRGIGITEAQARMMLGLGLG